jgi:hypothetical protein
LIWTARSFLGETNRQLHEAIYELIAEGKNRVVLNLEKVLAIDSSGLGEIVASYSTLAKSRRKLEAGEYSDACDRHYDRDQALHRLDVYDSEADAVNSFEERGSAAA